MEEVENRCRNFSDAMIGVHIRRTDNLASIRQSPIELFYQKLDEKIKEDGKVAIYLATDSEEVKRSKSNRQLLQMGLHNHWLQLRHTLNKYQTNASNLLE